MLLFTPFLISQGLLDQTEAKTLVKHFGEDALGDRA